MNDTDNNTDNDLKILTFGCRLNAYESEVIRANAKSANLTNAVIINSCAVTAEAERQVGQAIRRAKRNNPNARIIVTGCAAQINPDKYAAMSEVDRVLGNAEKMQVANFDMDIDNKVLVNDIMSIKQTAGHLIKGFSGRARAFIQVQNGCDHRCTFCIIPYGRGQSRSVPIGEIVKQVRLLVDEGYQEIILSGVDITSYGLDLPGKPILGQMVRRLLAQVPQLPRLRISSIDCIEIDDDLFGLIANEERLMPHLHLSLQAGDDMILKRMKRRHLRGDIIDLCQKLRRARPDIVLGADMIAGFPTESDEMFENSLSLIDECALTWLHIFPYSEREGTPAARIPNQVEKPIRKARAAKLRHAGKIAEQKFMRSQIGKNAMVLFEKSNMGRSQHFAPVRVVNTANNKPIAEGTLKKVRITALEDDILLGEII